MEKELTDEQIDARLDDAILKADPNNLTDEELDRRLELAQRKSFGQMTLDAAGDIAGAVSTVVDYPAGIARSGITNLADYLSDKKTGSEAISDFGESFKGPSNAPTSQDIARRMGVPDLPMGTDNFKPFGDIPQSAIAGTALDAAMAYPEAAMISKGMGAVGRGARSVFGSDEQALKAVGIRRKDLAPKIKISDFSDPYEDINALSKYAQENVITGGSGTESTLKRVKKKLQDVGTKIGEIRNKNQSAINDMLEKYQGNIESYDQLLKKKRASSPAESAMIERQMNGLNNQLPGMKDIGEYFKGTFTPKSSYERIDKEIASSLADVEDADKVRAIVKGKLDALDNKYQGDIIPIEDLTRLKSEWQRQLTSGRDALDRTVREDAYHFLQKEADRAISNEINFGDKILKGDDLAKHMKLKKEYGILKLMNETLSSKAAKEMTGANSLNPFVVAPNSTKVQSAIAKIPDQGPGGLATGGMAAGIQYGNISNMRQGAYKEPYVFGFPISQTQRISPNELAPLKNEIQQNSELSAVEKAKRLNLLNNGRVYLGN